MAGVAVAGGADDAAREAVASRYREAGLRPPEQAVLADALGIPPAQVSNLVAWLVRQKTLVPIEGTVPSLLERPVGCPFHTRCPQVMAGRCDTAVRCS